MTLETARRLFFEHLKKKGYAHSSIVSRQYTLALFFRYLKPLKVASIQDITQRMIKDYVTQRYYHINAKGKQNIPETRNNEIAVVKIFFSFLSAKELLQENPAKEISYIKEPTCQIPKDIMSTRELQKLFKQPDTGSLLGYRDRVCLELLYASAMRRKELVMLDVSDVNLKDQLVFIRQGKNHKDRIVPINDTATTYLRHYLHFIRPKLITKKAASCLALFLSSKGFRLQINGISLRVKTYVTKAKLKKAITMHSFRHTCATHLIQRGMSLRLVQELLGHKQLDTTVRYLQLSIKDLQREYRKSHPREKEM